MQSVNAGTYQLSVGKAVVTALHDCWFEVNSGDVVVGIGSEEATKQQQERFRPPPGRIDLAAFLIELGGRYILVDAGIGNHVKTSQIRSQLKRLGIEPANIHTILLTHAHADHVGGLLDKEGVTYFPNAEIVLHEREVNFWLDKDLLEKTPAHYGATGRNCSWDILRLALHVSSDPRMVSSWPIDKVVARFIGVS